MQEVQRVSQLVRITPGHTSLVHITSGCLMGDNMTRLNFSIQSLAIFTPSRLATGKPANLFLKELL